MLTVFNPHDTTTTIDSVISEFAKLYPNPAKQLVNLAYYVKTTGMVDFEIFDQLGEPVLKTSLNGGGNFVQYSTGNLSNGVYYWRLRETERTIKVGKLVIMK